MVFSFGVWLTGTANFVFRPEEENHSVPGGDHNDKLQVPGTGTARGSGGEELELDARDLDHVVFL